MGEKQNNIPEGWKSNELGKLIVEKKKSGLKVSDATNFGQFPFFTSGDAILNHNEKQIEGENIFLATGGVANIKYFKGEASYSTDTYVISTNDEIETQYLYFDLLNIIEYINANYFQGSGLKHLQKKDLKKYIIHYPENTTEQTQIAAILSKVDEAIAQTQQLIAKYSRIKTGLMQDLLTKGIDENGNIRSEETHEFKDSPLGRIPKEWEIVKLGELSEIRSGLTLGKKYPEYGTLEMPYLRVANVQDGFLDLKEIKYTRVPINQIGKLLLEKGDVLMNEGGDYDKLGRGSVWRGEIANCLHQNHIFKVRLDKLKMAPEFLAFYSASSFGKTFFIVSSKQSTNLASINKTQLLGFPIIKPELNEQYRIIKILDNYSNLLNDFDSNHSKLQSQKTGLMQDLLSGKVRVKVTEPLINAD